MPKLSPTEQVTLFIKNVPPEISEAVALLREIILEANILVAEEIKWNNPCFYYSGEMYAYNPKEYKREIVVFNLFKNKLMLVFPLGAKVKNHHGLLQGNFKDDRKTIIFKDKDDVIKYQQQLQNVINELISLIDK